MTTAVKSNDPQKWVVAGNPERRRRRMDRKRLQRIVHGMLKDDRFGCVYRAMATGADIPGLDMRKIYAEAIEAAHIGMRGMAARLLEDDASRLEADGWRLVVGYAVMKEREEMRLPEVPGCDVETLEMKVRNTMYRLIYARPCVGQWNVMEEE